jgi:hypothetical protein
MSTYTLKITDQKGQVGTLDYDWPIQVPIVTNYDWSQTNVPWDAVSQDEIDDLIPAGHTIVPLSTTGTDFYAKLNNTLALQSGRVSVRLPPGFYDFTQFRMIGSSGDPTYSFGHWSPKLAGFIGNPKDTFVRMAPNSMTQAQLDKMATMTQSSFSQLQQAVIRIDTVFNNTAVPIVMLGITFESGPQQLLTAHASDIPASVFVPQPAPHGGLVIYSSNSIRHPDSIVAYCRFRGFGKAMMSQPPFELANVSSQRNQVRWYKCEFDGRMSPNYDPAQPRKCGPFMTNGGINQEIVECYMHDTNVSRFAANDESVSSTTALSNRYYIEHTKFEHITDNQNRQPGINGGNSLGGYTNASCLGFESSNARIDIIDCIVSVDNPYTNGQVPCHIQLTNTGSATAANRPGGRLYVKGGQYRHTVFPQLDGFVTFRIQQSTAWWIDGFNTTLDVRDNDDKRLQPYVVTGTWPPSQAALDTANVKPETHYLVRST